MKESIKKIENLKIEINSKLETISTTKDLNELKTYYLGKKGPINELTSVMKDLELEDKKTFGALLNSFKEEVNNSINSKQEYLQNKELEDRLKKEDIDISLPSTKIKVGSIHPLMRVIEEIEEVFI